MKDGNWKTFSLASPPRECGVYAIKRGRDWLYIGKAKNIASRINARTHPAQITADFLGLSYCWMPAGANRHSLEQRLIQQCQPEWNGGTTFDACPDSVHGPRCAYAHVSEAKMLKAILEASA